MDAEGNFIIAWAHFPNIDRLFDKFYRADNSLTRATTGTGLGLAICRRIAESNGGSISLESEPNKGTTFCMRLPLGETTDGPASVGC